MNAIDLISLPRLTALGALALAEQLLSAAAPRKKDFPSSADGARRALDESRSGLAAALRDRVDPVAGAADVPALDRDVDGAWAGLSSFTEAFARLPGGGELAEHARVVQTALFPDGLRFTQLAYPLEWAESQVRLERMATPEIAAALKALGAKKFVDTIRAAHDQYGKALGMGAAKTAAPAPAVRPAYLALLLAMRWYVVKVVASADPTSPETQAVVDALLVPLTTWSVPTGKRKSGQGEPARDEVANPTEPVVTDGGPVGSPVEK